MARKSSKSNGGTVIRVIVMMFVWVFYLLWGRKHSALNDGGDGIIESAAPGVDDVEIVTPPKDAL